MADNQSEKTMDDLMKFNLKDLLESRYVEVIEKYEEAVDSLRRILFSQTAELNKANEAKQKLETQLVLEKKIRDSQKETIEKLNDKLTQIKDGITVKYMLLYRAESLGDLSDLLSDDDYVCSAMSNLPTVQACDNGVALYRENAENYLDKIDSEYFSVVAYIPELSQVEDLLNIIQ